MREWLVIERSCKNGVFAPDDAKKPTGYIPRSTAEALLGRCLGGTVWFTKEDSDKMRSHPEWSDTEPSQSKEKQMSTAHEVQLRQIEAMRRMVPQWIETMKALAAMNAKLAERWGELMRRKMTQNADTK